MTHVRSHGGYAAQATRRGEDWIACVDCTNHSRARLMQATPSEPVEQWGPLKIAVTVVVIIAVIYALVTIGAVLS